MTSLADLYAKARFSLIVSVLPSWAVTASNATEAAVTSRPAERRRSIKNKLIEQMMP
jgi:hypothetical protein